MELWPSGAGSSRRADSRCSVAGHHRLRFVIRCQSWTNGSWLTAESLGDYFRVWNLDAAGFYDVELDVSNLALALLSDDLSQVLDYRLNEFPKVLEDVVPNQEGELFLAVCATDGNSDWTLAECETGFTDNEYLLTVTDAPEPGAIALDLAALLCLAALSRQRLRRRA